MTAILSDHQREEYLRHGSLFVPGFVDTSEFPISDWANEVPLVGDVTFEKGNVTRCENFVDKHEGWRGLATGRMARVCAALFGEPDTPAALFKEKLNYKPPGGMGFMPHLDHPSLAFYAPASFDRFITVMVAIDDMTSLNGCLRVSKGHWEAANAVPCIEPEGDPEVGGRAGGIVPAVVEALEFEDIVCRSGDVLFFHGYVPHRSGANRSAGYRRAVFFTFNPASHGHFREQYYDNLARIRNEWKEKLCREMQNDYQNDLQALATIPTAFDRSRYQVQAKSSLTDDNAPSSEDDAEINALF